MINDNKKILQKSENTNNYRAHNIANMTNNKNDSPKSLSSQKGIFVDASCQHHLPDKKNKVNASCQHDSEHGLLSHKFTLNVSKCLNDLQQNLPSQKGSFVNAGDNYVNLEYPTDSYLVSQAPYIAGQTPYIAGPYLFNLPDYMVAPMHFSDNTNFDIFSSLISPYNNYTGYNFTPPTITQPPMNIRNIGKQGTNLRTANDRWECISEISCLIVLLLIIFGLFLYVIFS